MSAAHGVQAEIDFDKERSSMSILLVVSCPINMVQYTRVGSNYCYSSLI